MELDTKYFGAIRCDEESILHFPDGIFAFEEEKEFLLIPFKEGEGSMLCLQSVATPQLAFVVMDPFYLDKSYAPVLTPKELEMMEASCSENLIYYSLCVVQEPISKSRVNLKCPVVINDVTRQGRQVILDQYEMRHLLSEFAVKEEESTC